MKRIAIPEEGIETLFGSYDENLKHLEAKFQVRIRTQGHELLIDGDPPGPDNVDRIITQLSLLMRDGYKLSPADVKTASDLVAQDQTVDLREHFLRGSLTPGGKRRIAPKSINQRRYLDAIDGAEVTAVGGNRHPRTELSFERMSARLHADDAILVHQRLADGHRRLELRAGRDCILQQHPVEMAAQQRPARDAVLVARLDSHPSLACHAHAGNRQPARVDTGCHLQAAKQRQRSGIHRVAAQLVARKRAAIDDAHARPGTCQHRRRNGAGRPATHHQYVNHHI